MLNLDRVLGRPWAITSEVASLAQELYRAGDAAGLRLLAELRLAAGVEKPEAAAARTAAKRGGNVAILPIIGMVTLRGGEVNCASTMSTLALRALIQDLATDSSIQAMVLEIDSPGGEVDGTPELAAAIRDARAAKPVVAMANSVAASAAYWIASQADEIISTPSGAVGSIGVYVMHKDDSAAKEAAGVKLTVVSAGKYKAEGAVGPLSDEGVAYLQGVVDEMYGAFTADVAKGRGVGVDAVRKGYGQGRMVPAKAALEAGMIDAVGTVDDAIRRAAYLAQQRRSGNGVAALAEADGIRYRRARS